MRVPVIQIASNVALSALQMGGLVVLWDEAGENRAQERRLEKNQELWKYL